MKEPSPAPCAAAPSRSLPFGPALDDGMQRSLDALNAASHDIRLRLAVDERADKGTNGAYARHVRNYTLYWDRHQCEMVAQDPTWTPVPAMPITAAKALIFLNQERTREKVSARAHALQLNDDHFLPSFLFCSQRRPGSSGTIPGSYVGKSIIQQAISALEDWRMSHHHLYLGIPEAQVRLRDDNRIRQIESSAKHDEPKRAESSQVLKASGTTSGRCPHLLPLQQR